MRYGLLAVFLLLVVASAGMAQSSTFTYQGRLTDAGKGVEGTADFQFRLFDDAADGNQIGSTVVLLGATVVDGLVTADLDFGAGAFDGSSRWLQISVRYPAGVDDYVTLEPRQIVRPAPMAMFALDGLSATTPWQFNADDIYYLAGKVGIGTDSPSFALHVKGVIRTSTHLQVNDGDGGAERVRVGLASNGAGIVRVIGNNDSENARLTTFSGTSGNNGEVITYNEASEIRALMGVPPTGNGLVQTFGLNGNLNVNLGFFGNSPNNGAVSVHRNNGTERAGMFVDTDNLGVVFGDVKAFRVEHPLRADKEIWYACPEGPEAAIYHRGTATLEDGAATIELPEHFRLLASEDGMTVTVSPLAASSKGLAVIAKGLDGIEVRELFDGNGTYEFDFIVMGVRSGYENFQVIRPAKSLNTAPAHAGE